MNELAALIVGMIGDRVSVATLLRLAPVLAPVVADLGDGDARLSAESRLKVQEVLQDLKDGKL